MDNRENRDLEFLKEKFEQDGLKAPESLSRDKILSMIEESDARTSASADTVQSTGAGNGPGEGDFRRVSGPAVRTAGTGQKKRSRWKAVSAVAACLIAVLIATPVIDSIISRPPSTDLVGGELRTFESDRELRNLVKSLDRTDDYSFFNYRKEYVVYEEAATEDAAMESKESGAMAAGGNAKDADGYETYKQVEGVDEADIIKVSGNYIYHVTGEQEINIWLADKEETELVATISDFREDGYISNMYLTGNSLVAIGNKYVNDGSQAYVKIYDVSDPEAPVFVKEFEQSGNIETSRMTGGVLYLVSRYYANKEHYIPFVTDGSDNAFRAMDIADICTFPDPESPAYVIVSAIDVDNAKQLKSRSKAVFGAADTVYCNNENMFIAETEYRGVQTDDSYSTQITTLIAKIELNGGKLKFTKTGRVRGYLDGQFAMDEKDGFLRVATTSSRNGKDVNNLFVLDGNLEEVGKVTGFARNEHIEAVRFMGDKGYVITFERTDPLFVLDLADPTRPKIDGEVKIEGFSTLLVPVSENKLVGIGFRTAENSYGGVYTDGLKLALFDVSDPSKPKVLDSKEYRETYSEAQHNHHALLQNRAAGYLAIPYYYEHYEDRWEGDDVVIEDAEEPADDTTYVEEEEPEYEQHGGVLIFRAGDKLEIIEDHIVGTDVISRCVYIGDYLYAVDAYDDITGFKYAG